METPKLFFSYEQAPPTGRLASYFKNPTLISPQKRHQAPKVIRKTFKFLGNYPERRIQKYWCIQICKSRITMEGGCIG
jgi:hypothetical protein